MKNKIIICAVLIFLIGSELQAQKLFLSLEGRYSSLSLPSYRNTDYLKKLYVSPSIGYEIGDNFYIGLITKIYRSNYTTYLPYSPGSKEETENLNADKLGIFVDKNIELGEHFLFRIRPSLLYATNDDFSADGRHVEIQISPGLLYKAGEKIYIYTNFRGIGIDEGFYFDFGFVHLNLGLQYNFRFEE